MFVHTAGFLHKGIRQETILVFDQTVLFSTRIFQVPLHLSWLDSRDSGARKPKPTLRRFRVGKEPLPSPCKTGSLGKKHLLCHMIYTALGCVYLRSRSGNRSSKSMKTWHALGQICIYRVQYPIRIHGRVDMQLKSASLL
jgi:hypothetical protein